MRFPTMWYVRPAKAQTSLSIHAVLSEPLLIAEIFYHVKLLTEHHLEFLSLKGGCTGSPESTHAKMPYCWNRMSRLNYISFSEDCFFFSANNIHLFHLGRHCLPKYPLRGFLSSKSQHTHLAGKHTCK